MDLFTLVAVITALVGIAWLLEACTLGFRRLVQARQVLQEGGSRDQVFALVKEPAINTWMRIAFICLLVPLLYLAIRKSMDFAILLVIATSVSGFIYALDVLLLGRIRNSVIEGIGKAYPNDDDMRVNAHKLPELIEYSRSFFPVLAVVLVLRSFLIEPYQIPSGSMRPTLEIGDFIAVNKFAYGFKLPITGFEIIPVDKPKTGDVIVFKPPHQPGKTFIKRVVGLPGDHVRYSAREKRLWVNGKEVATEYIDHRVLERGHQVRRFEEQLGETKHQIYEFVQPNPMGSGTMPKDGTVVPEGKYFVMGDNRDNSEDSRYWGYVEERAILGKAFAVWMHWRGFSSLPSFSRNKLID